MKDTELIRAKSFGIAAVAYSFNDLFRCAMSPPTSMMSALFL